MIMPLLFVLAAYVLGAVPVSFWIGKLFYGKDLTNLGSGNLGATNAFRMLGVKAGIPVIVLDLLKGFAPALYFPLWDGQEATWWAVVYGATAIFGHVFSFWVGFRGGKGVATSAGVLAALMPSALVTGIGVWLLVVFITRIVSLASIAAALVVPVWALVVPDASTPLRGFLVVLGLFVLWAHRSNLQRLRAGKEHRIGDASDDSDEVTV